MSVIDDEYKVEVVHVVRPLLPWRDTTITECGLPSAGHPTISRGEFIVKVKAQGKQRAAMTTCMTCFDTAMRHPTWEEDPVLCIARETSYYRRNDRFRKELRALAALVTRHRAEFDELLTDQDEIVPLSSRTRNRPARPQCK